VAMDQLQLNALPLAVGIRVVDLESLGKDVCGGLVASNRRVCLCLASECDVEKYRCEKAM
jgi:hypothetical protein